MELVGHLLGVRRSARRPLGVGGTPVSRDDFDAGMRYEPSGQSSSGPIWQQVDGSVPVSIDQNRAVGAAAATAASIFRLRIEPLGAGPSFVQRIQLKARAEDRTYVV